MFIKNWMTRDLITIGPDEPLSVAQLTMKNHRIRRLPVVEEEDRLLGLLTPGDIVRAMPAVLDPAASGDQWQQAGQMPVRMVMSASPIAVSPEDTLEHAALLMRRHKIGGLPVIHDGRLVGILTETNLLDVLIELLGGELSGSIRLDVSLGRSPGALFDFFDLVREYDVDPLAVVQHCNSCRDRRRLTLRLAGRQAEELLRELGESREVMMTSIQRPEEN